MGAYSCFWWVNQRSKTVYLFPSALKIFPRSVGAEIRDDSYSEYKLVVVWLNGFPGRILIPLDTTGRKDLTKR